MERVVRKKSIWSRLYSTDLIALVISIVSLIFTLVSAYLSGLYTEIDLNVTISHVTWRISNDLSAIESSLNFALTNDGNKTIAITGVNLTLRIQENLKCPLHNDTNDKKNSFDIYVQDFKPVAIKSNDVAALSLTLKGDLSGGRARFKQLLEATGKETYGCMYLYVYSVAPIFGFDENNQLVGSGYFVEDQANMSSYTKSWTGNDGKPMQYRSQSRLY